MEIPNEIEWSRPLISEMSAEGRNLPWVPAVVQGPIIQFSAEGKQAT